ncbi:hypothetical protein IAQ61_009416 [Plenodomus lingam]|uniref:uncharacterized protein n=1 Tax=Leptosphaeria maculans TaxID=5022 RepID=UPI00332E4961|nr:hypothetical protein IAQ61_009416 [Plenodomus lingam]
MLCTLPIPVPRGSQGWSSLYIHLDVTLDPHRLACLPSEIASCSMGRGRAPTNGSSSYEKTLYRYEKLEEYLSYLPRIPSVHIAAIVAIATIDATDPQTF